MLQIAMVLVTLSCPATIIENQTKYRWNYRDGSALDRAMENCKNYYEHSPCLVKFVKKTKYDYNAICGAKREQN